MSYKLSSAQIAEWEGLISRAREAHHDLYEAIKSANTLIEQAIDEMASEKEAFNTAISQLIEFAHNTAGDWRDSFNNKSESWQESDTGQSTDDFIRSWESFDGAEFEPNLPDTFDAPDDDIVNDAENLDTISE